jgi:hypothetical protein
VRALWRRNALTVVFVIACSGSSVAHWGLDHRNGSEFSFRSIKSDFAQCGIFDLSYYNGVPWLRRDWNPIPDYGNRGRPPFTEGFIFICICGIGISSERGSLSHNRHEFCDGCSDPSLLAKVLLWKKYLSITCSRAFNLLNVHITNPSIGGDQIWKEFYFETYLSSWGPSNVCDLDLNGGFYVFARDDNRLSLDHIHINPNPWSISSNQRFAIYTICFLGGPSVSVCGGGGALGGLYRLRALQNGSPSREPQQGRENPKPGSGNEKSGGKPSYPPVWFRIPLALFLGIGSNGVLVWGLSLSDDRRIGRAVICALGIAMMLAGLSLALMLGIPATWGWWV